MMRLSQKIWDTDPVRETSEWTAILDALRLSLSDHIGLRVNMVDSWTDEGVPEKISSICSRIKIPISTSLKTFFVGSLCMTVSRGKSVSISADLLFFVNGIRHTGDRHGDYVGNDILMLRFTPYPRSIGPWSEPALVNCDGGWEDFQQESDLDKRY